MLEADTAWVVYFVDNAISMEFQSFEDEMQCFRSVSIAGGGHFKALGEHVPREKRLLAPKPMAGWAL